MLFDKALRSGQLSQSDQAIVAYISQHPQDVVRMTSRELAEAAFVSQATISRLCKKAGFESFNDMKVQLAREQADEESFERMDADFPALAGASSAQVLGRVSSMEREAIRKTERLLCGVDWAPIVRAIDASSGIAVRALAYSMDTARPFVRNMRRLGWRVTACEEQSEAREWLTSCPRDELVLFVSYSGISPDLLDEARIVASRGIKSVAVTTTDSPLSHLVTWPLPIATTERPGANDRIAHFQSITAEAYALNALYAFWFASDYATHARFIVAGLDRQGMRVSRTDAGPRLERRGDLAAPVFRQASQESNLTES